MKLNSELQPSIDDRLIADIGQFFGYDVTSWSELSGGIENTVISALLSDGREKVQKHYNRNRNIGRISLELAILKQAHQKGVPVPLFDVSNNAQFTFHYTENDYEWHVVSMDKVRGKHPESYNGSWSAELAFYQANLHMLGDSEMPAGSDIDLDNDYSYFEIDASEHPDLAKIESSLSSHYEVVSRAWHNLPAGFSHHDVTRNNILVEEDELSAIIDFEDVARAPYIFCLGGTLWDIIQSTGIEAARKYLRDYSEVRTLTSDEGLTLRSMTVVRGWIDLHGKLLTEGYSSTNYTKALNSLAQLLAS